MPARICCVFGSWQLLSLVASLRQSTMDGSSPADQEHEDYLLLYETAGVSEHFKTGLAELASKVWTWRRIIWAYDLLTSERKYGQLQIFRIHRLIRDTIGLDASSVAEIWACFVNRPSEKILLDSYPEAKIVLYEDGLTSYLPFEMATMSRPPGTRFRRRITAVLIAGLSTISPAFRLRKAADRIERHHLRRVTKFYSLLHEIPIHDALENVPRFQVGASLMRDVIDEACRDALSGGDEHCRASANPRILLLGQALSRNRIMSYAQEAAIYRRIAEQIVERGYDVVWKEHPRISKPFFPELLDAVGNVTADANTRIMEANLPHIYPIELVVSRMNIVGCVSGTSAALLYLKWLYGIKTYTFAETLVPLMTGADILMSEMVKAHAEPFSTLQSLNETQKGIR
ncbi:alpha-2,8-polysialyltransferase family protein [Mesorhizobium sp. WSM1497]|uniref:alpha-2,8-polysialyltransferase family protein n=1 Tax=Mesorhizobium sp. WSM1497 TaxID=278153 RepID=UPI001FDACA8F|nr:alpha-2,8-polysialyltransferase family protein [Mesorhizobium sp. WSM1497]